jgi:hypothetical protein
MLVSYSVFLSLIIQNPIYPIGIVHRKRKMVFRQNTTVYGCVTDSENWIFIQINDKSEVRWMLIKHAFFSC